MLNGDLGGSKFGYEWFPSREDLKFDVCYFISESNMCDELAAPKESHGHDVKFGHPNAHTLPFYVTEVRPTKRM